MNGIRAFGRNEGGLNHIGDFELLFSPLLPELSKLAVYGVEPGETLYFPFFSEMNDFDEASRLCDEVWEKLDQIDICPMPKNDVGTIYERYFKPGFFPDNAKYIRDDWSDLICFDEPYPKYEIISKANYGEKTGFFKRRDPVEHRESMLATNFQFYFRNIDACWWEIFSPRPKSIQSLVDYLKENKIDFQILEFDKDFPDPTTPVNREFKDVHTIWPKK